MADPTRKRLKDRGASAVAQSNVVPFKAAMSLRFWVTPADGTPPHEVDLTEFADGSAERLADNFGTFRGRPSLINSLLPGIVLRHGAAPKESFRQIISRLRGFWRFLEQIPEELAPKVLEDLNEVMAALWLKSGASLPEYKSVKGIVIASRESAGLNPLTWPSKASKPPREANAICPIAMRRLYNALKHEASRLQQPGADLGPGREEQAIFFLLFAIQSGWNPETNLNIDVSSDDAWHNPHPHRPELVVLRSVKRKVKTQQIALSLRRPQFHMFRILQSLISRTAPLREEVRRRIADLDMKLQASPGDMKLRAIRVDLQAVASSPWAFISRNDGQLSRLKSGSLGHVNEALRAVITSHDVRDAQGRLISITVSDLRDAWIGYAYASSGYSWLVAKLAAGHANAATLRTYLRQRQWRSYGEERFATLLDAAFSEIRHRRIIDGAVLRRMVEAGEITEQQRQRWSEHKSRTRIGLGCRNPTSPPRAVAPDHPQGEICRVQRCALCVHGLVFADSLDGLARRKAELTHIRETIPVGAWLQSTFGEELEALENTLKLFPIAEVSEAYASWIGQIRAGTVYVFDQEGSI